MMAQRPSVKDVFIGCAGWSIPASSREKFPEAGAHLERYAERLNGVEINSSFYRAHQGKTYARWRESVLRGFRFTVKVPKRITHELRLKEARELFVQFLSEVENLDEKLGVLLVQLPPSLKFEAGVVEEFFGMVRRETEVAMACEPRHASWRGAEVEELLSGWRIGRVVADPVVVEAGESSSTAPLSYFRLHGSPKVYYSAYDRERLEGYGAQILEERCAGREVWCIFDNTAEGAAVENALELQRMVEAGDYALSSGVRGRGDRRGGRR